MECRDAAVQLIGIAQDLNYAITVVQFPQSTVNTTRMGQVLFDLLNGKNLRIYPARDLRQQALNTVAIEGPRGFRIAKEKTSKKIDAIVALAMACISAVEVGKPTGSVSDIVLGRPRLTASPDALALWPRRNWKDDFWN